MTCLERFCAYTFWMHKNVKRYVCAKLPLALYVGYIAIHVASVATVKPCKIRRSEKKMPTMLEGNSQKRSRYLASLASKAANKTKTKKKENRKF